MSHKYFFFKFSLSVLFSLLFMRCVAQADADYTYSTFIGSESIKTLRTYVDGNEQSYPVVELDGEQVIQFEFDELTSGAKNYQYQIIHCNSNWKISDLFSDEFMDGFNENSIVDYEFSENTTIPYVHYQVRIPNDDVQLKVSGNYAIRVIEDGDREKTIAMATFSIFENVVGIKAELTRPLGAQVQDRGQELRLSVIHHDLVIDDPFTDVKLLVLQNGRFDKKLDNIKPVFVRNGELVYSFSGENIMEGGNEFRTFDIKSLKLYGLNVNDIAFDDSAYHVQLRIDERRSYKRYFWEKEMNGRFIVYVNNSWDFYKTADYAYVYFILPMPEPVIDGEIFVLGNITNWQQNENSKMTYNYQTGNYEKRLLVKQGYYDYYYSFKSNYPDVKDDNKIDGSHFETENDYLVYVYHRGFSDRYDRLVGYRSVNTKY